MFSRDYHDPRSHALWGIRVLGTTVCINTGLDMNYFDYCTGLTMTNDRFAKLFGAPA